MAEISINIDRESDLTIIAIEGILEKDDLLDALSEYFSSGPTLNTIYDSTAGDWSKISTDTYLEMIRSAKRYARKEASVAMVFSSEVDFGIGRMIESFAEHEGYENRLSCFRTLQEARNWLTQLNR
ncbi:MAG: hypothetical protein WDZ52_14050 [Pseudohongiellaceae bacterium]